MWPADCHIEEEGSEQSGGAKMMAGTARRRIRLRAIASYDGRNFHGVQKNVRTQDNTELRTITSTLETSLWPALDQNVKFRVAGRTDAGVSATGQVISFDVESAGEHDEPLISVDGAPVQEPAALMAALNECLPSDLQLRGVEIVPREFDVTRDCKWKRYRYALPACSPSADDEDGLRLYKMVASQAARASDGADGGARPSRKGRRKAAASGIVDVEAMRRACRMLEGTHDFAAFQASRGDQKGTVRTLYRCAIEPRRDTEGDAIDLVLEGDGFLYKQVRIIAGTLAMIGMGLAPAEIIDAALADTSSLPKEELRRNGLVGPTLPPERLCLEHIEYEREHEQAVEAAAAAEVVAA